MYARLWWKDARQFWPIWLVLILAAAGTQWLILIFAGRQARFGMLGISALGWACLYALTVGAAAFAGERETGTLKLLDNLPADRRIVWAGKVSFALVTALALTLVFLAMAAVSTERWNPQHPLDPFDAACVCMIVPAALGWGLLWSSVLKTSLGAAFAAIPCIGATLIIVFRGLDAVLSGSPFATNSFGLTQITIVIITVAASTAFFAGGVRRKRVNVQFRSPIVVTREQSRHSRRILVRSPVAATPVYPPQPRPMAVTRIPEAADAAPVSRRSWLIEARTLAFQTIREAWPTWLSVAAIVIALPALAFVLDYGYVDVVWLMILIAVAALVAGVSVLGLENRARTYRFLVHHGASPGLVWMVKLATWIIALGMIAIAVGLGWMFLPISMGRSWEHWGLAVLSPLLAFAVALICGMTFRRGITSFVMATVLSLGLLSPLLFLVVLNLVPDEGLVWVIIALLVISWAWRADWMLDRPGAGRWLRVGLYVFLASALLLTSFIGYRLWSVRDIGPIAPPAAWNAASSIPISPQRNAAELYREAARSVDQYTDPQEFLRRNQAALDLIRRAAALEDCRFGSPEERTLVEPGRVPPLSWFHHLVAGEARARFNRGDLAGTWDDIIVLFNMARHFSEGSGIEPALLALKVVERDGLNLAFEWAMAPGQTPERLHAALAAYRDLPKMPSSGEIISAEANIVENTLNLSASSFREYLAQPLLGPHPADGPTTLYVFASTSMIAAPWERARARRVNRLMSASEMEIATREPWQRSRDMGWWRADGEPAQAIKRTPSLLMSLFGNAAPYIGEDDRNLVGRRALELILALRSWQLKHNGQLPDDLRSLVPDELASLPKDPYSNGSFGYVPYSGQKVQIFPSALGERPIVRTSLEADPPPGSRVLYSIIGPDRHDDHGAASADLDHTPHIGFVIPAIEPKVPAEKDKKAPETSKNKPAPTAPK